MKRRTTISANVGLRLLAAALAPPDSRMIDHAMAIAKKIADSDILGVRKWSKKRIRKFLVGGRDGDERDMVLWAAATREAKRRDLKIKTAKPKYHFW